MEKNPSPLGEDFSIVNPKFEYRNPKQIQNPNDGNSKHDPQLVGGIEAFLFWTFAF
jgi:hypothetical protein